MSCVDGSRVARIFVGAASRPAAASRPGLQSRQLHAHAGFAKGGRALVADHAAGDIGEDRCQGGQPWPVRHVLIGRGGGGRGNRRPGENDRRGVSEWRKIWTNGLPSEGRSPKSGHWMAAEGMPFSWRGNGGTISLNLGVIWEMSVHDAPNQEHNDRRRRHCRLDGGNLSGHQARPPCRG